MPSKLEIRTRLTALAADIDADLATVPPPSMDSRPETIVVEAGANLPSLIERSAGDTLFVLAPGYVQDLAEFTIDKPCMLVADRVPVGRATSAPGPTLVVGSVKVKAPDVLVRGVRLQAKNREAALIEAGSRTSIVQCYLDGGPAGVKRGVLANAAGVTVDRSVIVNVRHTDDSQAIVGWSGTKNLRVFDSQLEAAGENIMLGGGDPSSEADTPQDVTVQHCWLRKPVGWRGMAGTVVKNLFELKNARRVRVLNCILENNWGGQGQTGYAITLTVRNQYGGAPYSTIEDVAIEDCIVRNAASGVQILARDDSRPSGRMARVAIRRNRFEGLAGVQLAGAGHQIFISAGPEDLEIVGNTFTGSNLNSFLSFDGPSFTADRMVVTDNFAQEGEYGIFGSSAPGLGKAALDMYAPGCRWARNTIARGPSGRWVNYPDGTTVV